MTPERSRGLTGPPYASVVLPRIRALRYVTPLREGGSLPGIVEADDEGTYVLKFRGAGQGPKVLVAEIVVGELARALGLRVPDLRVVDLDAQIARYEADEEVQDLLTASVGLNLGIDFLPGSFGYDGSRPPSPETAARILWLDAFTANVDRTWRNPNLLVWHGRTWADRPRRGAVLPPLPGRASGSGPTRFAAQPFDAATHVLLDVADDVPAADAELAPQVTADLLDDVVARCRTSGWSRRPGCDDPAAVRAAYVENLLARLAGPRAWLPVAAAAAGDERSLVGYQYVVLRCVPRVEREEFVNVGVVLYSQAADFLEAALPRRPGPAPGAGTGPRPRRRRGVPARHRGRYAAGPPARGLPVLPRHGARFGWISAPRSTVIQPGPVHGGLTADPAATLPALVGRLVG